MKNTAIGTGPPLYTCGIELKDILLRGQPLKDIGLISKLILIEYCSALKMDLDLQKLILSFDENDFDAWVASDNDLCNRIDDTLRRFGFPPPG